MSDLFTDNPADPAKVWAALGIGPSIDRFPNWRRSRAYALSGVSRATILCTGDSTTQGTGGVPDGVVTEVPAIFSYPAKLARKLSALGVPASAESVFGTVSSDDSRLSSGSGEINDGLRTLNKGVFRLSANANASPISFTPSGPTDTCEVYFLTFVGGGDNLQLSVRGGPSATGNTFSSQGGVGWIAVMGSPGLNTYDTTSLGGDIFVYGFSAYNSAEQSVSVVNYGCGGAASVAYRDLWGGAAAQLAVHDPSLIIHQKGINSWLSGENPDAVYNNEKAFRPPARRLAT